MYAMAKNVANPALTSVRNLVPFRSVLWPENSSLNRLPTTLWATAILVRSTYASLAAVKKEEYRSSTQPITLVD
jgi:hypothetical protein